MELMPIQLCIAFVSAIMTPLFRWKQWESQEQLLASIYWMRHSGQLVFSLFSGVEYSNGYSVVEIDTRQSTHFVSVPIGPSIYISLPLISAIHHYQGIMFIPNSDYIFLQSAWRNALPRILHLRWFPLITVLWVHPCVGIYWIRSSLLVCINKQVVLSISWSWCELR